MSVVMVIAVFYERSRMSLIYFSLYIMAVYETVIDSCPCRRLLADTT